MALPTEVIEALTRGEPIQEKALKITWVAPILELIQTGVVRPTKELWGWEIQWRDCRLAHEAARRGLLPKDFDQWHLTDKDGWAVAHVAARWGHLPQDFDQWDLVDHKGWTVAHVAAKHGHLPSNFDQWHLTDQEGRPVAHMAALCGHLPSNFDQWHLTDQEGHLVAHVAAQWDHLPQDFDQWALADQNGWTVAHVAATWGHLPKDFDQWHWTDSRGWTVAETMIGSLYPQPLPEKDRLDFWLAPTSKGYSVMDFALERGVITSEEYEAIQQVVLKVQQAEDQARMKTLSGMVF